MFKIILFKTTICFLSFLMFNCALAEPLVEGGDVNLDSLMKKYQDYERENSKKKKKERKIKKAKLSKKIKQIVIYPERSIAEASDGPLRAKKKVKDQVEDIVSLLLEGINPEDVKSVEVLIVSSGACTNNYSFNTKYVDNGLIKTKYSNMSIEQCGSKVPPGTSYPTCWYKGSRYGNCKVRRIRRGYTRWVLTIGRYRGIAAPTR